MTDEQELIQYAQHWKSLDNREARNKYYDETVFPQIIKVVVPRERAKYPQSYPYLILPVGLAPEPLILSIQILQPERVCLLFTHASEQYLDRIVKDANLRIRQVVMEEIDETNVPDVYQKVKDVYARWGNPEKIAVDISGGKKSMVGGCALAGAVIGAHLFYVDSDFIQELRKPEPGSEALVVLENPYDVFGDLKLNRVIELYREQDFVGAQRLLEELARETSTPQRYQARADLCRAYALWDDWQIKDAGEALRTVIFNIERYARVDLTTPLYGQLPRLRNQANILARLLHAQQEILQPEVELHVLSNFDTFLPILGTLYAGALRQERRGKRDVAALLWYRTIELMSQQCLSCYGLRTGAPDYSVLKRDLDQLLAAYGSTAMASKNSVSPAEEGLPFRVDLLKGYRLLKALGDPYVHGLNLGELRGKVNARDQSQFAHGFVPLNAKDYTEFKNLAERLLAAFLSAKGLDSAVLEDYHFIEALS